MAEPSLQLGNGNWAGKSGNLLAYHKANNNFYADELTFARASSGTRVNSDGLIETASVISPTELVNNGDFATDTGWNKNANWSISGGVAIADGTSSADLNQGTLSAVIGTKYLVSFDVVSLSQGTFKTQIGGVSVTGNALGSFSGEVVATSTDRLRVIAQSNAIGSIDNVSVKEYTTSNVPRVDYLNNANGSLLLEPQSTNLIPYSEDFSNAAWAKEDLSVSANATTSPDGATNADLLLPNTNNIDHSIYDTTNSATEAFTVFLKAGGYNYAFLGANNNVAADGAFFDLANGVVSQNTSTLSASIEDYGNGWYRCSLFGSFSGIYRIICTSENGTSFIHAGDGIKGVYAYGAQVEAGSYATSLINTSGTAVTRLADAVSKTGVSSLIGGTSGTIFFDVVMNESLTNTNYKQFFYYTDSSATQTYMYVGATNYVQGNATLGNITSSTQLQAGERYKIAVTYATNSFKMYINGSQDATSSSGTPVDNENILSIGSFSGSSEFNEFGFNQYAHFKEVLSDTELATLTTI